jgi:pimeloyl-ACP methyl ester carboxylesterase
MIGKDAGGEQAGHTAAEHNGAPCGSAGHRARASSWLGKVFQTRSALSKLSVWPSKTFGSYTCRSMSQIAHRTIQTNGIAMHIAEQGEGPTVVLCHGFPELWYSWRHQIGALADAGYHVVAPDQRGYGGTDRPEPIEDYDILHLTDDLLGLLDALGHDDAVFIGHDWGAPVVWNLALRAPERVRGVVGMSVPFLPRGDVDPISLFETLFGDTFFYMLYFQEPGVADADLGRDPRDTIHRFASAISAERSAETFQPLPKQGTRFADWLPDPGPLPRWLTEDDLDYYASEFSRTGFTGGLNWYRNMRRNWVITEDLAATKVASPALFIAGEMDPVVMMASPVGMEEWVPDLRGTVMLPATGHWTQQERPAEVNAALVDFLSALN